MMINKDNWQETQERFTAWWNHRNIDRPLMYIMAKKKKKNGIAENRTGILLDIKQNHSEKQDAIHTANDGTFIQNSIKSEPVYKNEIERQYLDVPFIIEKMRSYFEERICFAEAYPSASIDLGAGSMALYLGSEPVFAPDTIWFHECIDNWTTHYPLQYDPNNKWWKLHLQMIKEAKKLANEDFIINIPDLVENVDILSALRGPQPLCYDLVDEPEMIKELVNQLDEIYFTYYNTIYNIVKLPDKSSSFTAFRIWGPGRTAKIQCDFCALMSPQQFRDFVLESLRKQCKYLNHSLYHLDGPDAIKHLDALMEIEELDAVQWTAGAGQVDGGNPKWYPIYDKVIGAGKSMWISIEDGTFEDWVKSADNLVKRYGPGRLYLLFPEMEEEQAISLMEIANRDWIG